MPNPAKPITYQANLAKLPRALSPLVERPQWAIWRWVPVNGGWSKPPFQARNPQQHASTRDPNTWSDYPTALAAVQDGRADGITYVLTEQDGFAALDLDHCRTAETGSVEHWAQHMLARALHSYCEITPSGSGLRIWGTATGDALHRKFALNHNADAAVELFRRTNKALTITGLDLRGRTLGGLDQLIDWAVIFAGRHKPKPAAAPTPVPFNSNGGSKYKLDAIDNAIRTGALLDGTPSRSETFHIVVGHLAGCGWSAEQIFAHLEQFPQGIGERYLSEDRLSSEIARSLSKYNNSRTLFDVASWAGPEAARLARTPQLEGDTEPDDLEEEAPPELEPEPELEQPTVPDADVIEEDDDEELLEEEELDEAPPDPNLPQLFCYGDPDPRPLTSWLIKGLIPACGHGLLAGQWGTYKTFMAIELSAAVINMQPFLDCLVKRQCGVAYFAAEGQAEIRKRVEALMHAKYANPAAVPFLWYETVPTLLQPKAIEQIVAMGRRAEATLQDRFGLPLGLLFIDTIAACAGYAVAGAENDPAVCQALMNVLKTAARELNCFAIGIDHYGKNLGSGVRGGSPKEDWPDVVLACLGDRDQDGAVHNTRISVRKCRVGPAGHSAPFTVREVAHPEPDEDGQPIKTLVIEWRAGPAVAGAGARTADPWQRFKRTDQRQNMLRLRRVLMAMLAEHGVSLPTQPNGPVVRMVDREIVRPEFYAQTAVEEGTEEQKLDTKSKQFRRVIGCAEEANLIGIREIGSVTYLWLNRPEPDDEGDGC